MRRTKSTVGSTWRALTGNWLIYAAILLLLAPALLDVPWLAQLTDSIAYTREAVIGLVSILVTARIVEVWSKRREEVRDKERFKGLERIAFRSLSHTVNDVGRILLAPVVGASLHAAGIPGFAARDHVANVAKLREYGLTPQAQSASGFWTRDDERESANLTVLAGDRDFVNLMFRATSLSRRRLQEAMADWAPVMVTVPEANEQLEPGWEFADQLVQLAEAWRNLSVALAVARPAQDAAQITTLHEEVTVHFATTIRQYRAWLDKLQAKAALPTKGALEDARVRAAQSVASAP